MTLNDILNHYKTAGNAAKKLGYSRQALWNWKHHGIPLRTQAAIQVKSMGRLRADWPKK